MLPKKVKNPWNRYCELMRRHPKAFVQSDGLPIITDPFAVSEFANQTGVEIGVIYESPVWFWVVDLVQGPEGLVASERLLPVRKEAEVVAIPVYNDRYFVLVEEGRQVLQNAQLAFPRGEGIPGMSPAQNAAERLAEALQAEVLSYGMLGQETNGAGGMFKAFRTIPVILGIVEDMKELCPDAWLVNFTNPSGMVTEAVVRYGKWEKVIGLCNVPVGAMIKEPKMIGKTLDELIYKFVGLNHFHWHKVFDLNGHDVTQQIIDKLYDPETDAGIPANIFDVKFFKEQLDQMGMIPCGYHRYYYRQEEMLNHMIEEYNDPEKGTRAQQVKQTEAELFELYKDPNLDHKPEQLAKRGGAHYSDAACETIASIYANKNTHIVVSTRNNGAVPDLPPECVVEVSAHIGACGALPIAFGPLHPAQKGWLQVMKNMELCVCEAAVTGDYGMALQAFILNPQVPSGTTAKRVLDELLIAHKKYLPQFAEKIAELEKEGVTIKDDIARELTEQGL